jgi:glycosyltransferase involved in cell wall biosynthesis
MDSESWFPVRVLVLSAALHGGGAEYVARTWAVGLAARGHQVTIATTGRDGGSMPDIEVETISVAGGGLAATIGRLRRLVRKRRFDVVLSLQTFPNLVAILATVTLPKTVRPRVFVSERNLVSLGIPGSSLSHRAKIRLARAVYRRAYGVIAISHPVAAELVSWFGVPGERCTVVPNPATAKVAGMERPVMRTLDMDSEITVVMPARQVVQKQPWLAVETAAVLRDRGYRVKVVSFGNGPLSDQTTALAAKLGVEYRPAGWVENWCADLPQNSVVVLSSLREGFGNVLVECAAVGVPAVALSSALGVADAIVPGITGALALTDSPQAVADAVEKCRHILPVDVTPWLDRFGPSNSLDSLEQVLAGRA